MTSRHTLSLLSALFLLHACEKVDVSPDKGVDASVQRIVPTSLGQGTQDSPYTVSQVLSGEVSDGVAMDAKLHWFVGYVVGSTYTSMDNAVFDSETTNKSNILISDNPNCESSQECVPVDLKSASLQQQFSLVYNPERFRQCIIVRGRYGSYFRVKGIRELSSGYWLSGIDLDNLNSFPSDWEENSFTY